MKCDRDVDQCYWNMLKLTVNTAVISVKVTHRIAAPYWCAQQFFRANEEEFVIHKTQHNKLGTAKSSQ